MKVWAHGPGFLRFRIPASHFIAVAGGPNYIGIGRIRNGKAGFTTAHVVIPSRYPRIDRHAGAAHVSVILHVGVDVVGNLVIDVHVIHLSDRQLNSVKATAVDGGDN